MDQYLVYLDHTVAGNTVMQLLNAVAIFCAVFIVLRIAKRVVIARLVKLSQKTENNIDDLLIGYVHGIKLYIYLLVSLSASVQGLVLPDSIAIGVRIMFLFVVVSLVVGIVEKVISYMVDAQMKNEDGTGGLPAVYHTLIRFFLWAMGLLLILSNLGVNVNSLIAGLGIGGLAISLALQSVLGDLFSSFSITVDKPFEEGDFIVVGDHKGTVKHIGLKTTRIEALEGEEIVISNGELTSARVQNYKRMEKRRVVFNFGCTYDASADQVEEITRGVKEIINDHDNVEVDRVHFSEFGSSELLFEAVYYILTSDYLEYMDTQQDINLRMMRYYEEHGLEMAFPTQTIYVKNEEEGK